ncbi:hypothetical protein [Ruegeria profundi]|uniref:Uncharacterized protein n=1 Tax=Ruegeria profundi TaxID=1685378 RepID=A0A0X3TPJ6_9RHOB|nr:hypothetical protein [Ruegeria profundi]KUJ77633.1 hypothetical protein AVO44_14950 [Ruegeria profundi]
METKNCVRIDADSVKAEEQCTCGTANTTANFDLDTIALKVFQLNQAVMQIRVSNTDADFGKKTWQKVIYARFGA